MKLVYLTLCVVTLVLLSAVSCSCSHPAGESASVDTRLVEGMSEAEFQREISAGGWMNICIRDHPVFGRVALEDPRPQRAVGYIRMYQKPSGAPFLVGYFQDNPFTLKKWALVPSSQLRLELLQELLVPPEMDSENGTRPASQFVGPGPAVGKAIYEVNDSYRWASTLTSWR